MGVSLLCFTLGSDPQAAVEPQAEIIWNSLKCLYASTPEAILNFCAFYVNLRWLGVEIHCLPLHAFRRFCIIWRFLLSASHPEVTRHNNLNSSRMTDDRMSKRQNTAHSIRRDVKIGDNVESFANVFFSLAGAAASSSPNQIRST